VPAQSGYNYDIDHYPSVQHHYDVAYDLHHHGYDHFDHRAEHDDLHRAAYQLVYDFNFHYPAPDDDDRGDQHGGDHDHVDDVTEYDDDLYDPADHDLYIDNIDDSA
jgi:hypothetical protein